MTDPALIDVQDDMTYVRLSGYRMGTTAISNPLEAEDGPREWNGAANVEPGDNDHQRLEVDRVSRGRWGFLYVETDDQELIDALEEEGHEPLTPDEFAATFDKAPEFIYLRTPSERSAKIANGKHRGLSIVELDEIIEIEEI